MQTLTVYNQHVLQALKQIPDNYAQTQKNAKSWER